MSTKVDSMSRLSRTCLGITMRLAIWLALLWSVGGPYYRSFDTRQWVQLHATMLTNQIVAGHLEVSYSYQLANRVYTASGFSLDSGAAYRHVELNHRSYPVGFIVNCLVDPGDPTHAILLEGKPWWVDLGAQVTHLLLWLTLGLGAAGCGLWRVGTPAQTAPRLQNALGLRLGIIGSILLFWALVAKLPEPLAHINDTVLIVCEWMLVTTYPLCLLLFQLALKPKMPPRAFNLLWLACIESGPLYSLIMVLLGAPTITFIPYAGLALMLLLG